MDLNKEIKLSDLFRRGAKAPREEAAASPEAEKPKQERRALFSRPPREKAPKTPKAPKERKERRDRGRSGAAVEERPAVEVPQIPLMRAFNLMPREEARGKKGGRAAVSQIAVALVGVLVVAGLAGGYLFTSAGVTSKQSELDDLRAQLAELEVPAEKPDRAAADAQAAAEGQARTTALATALAGRIAWDRILREVSLVVPDGVWWTQLTATTPNAAPGGAAAVAPAIAAGSSPNTLAVTGFAASQETVAVFLARLESIPELTSVQLLSSTRVDAETGRAYQFSIQAGVDPLGAPTS
jgi:Tfp pilus assembly protein PilN